MRTANVTLTVTLGFTATIMGSESQLKKKEKLTFTTNNVKEVTCDTTNASRYGDNNFRCFPSTPKPKYYKSSTGLSILKLAMRNYDLLGGTIGQPGGD
jgi:hypothetical protein